MSKLLNILHLSDLHYTRQGNTHNQEVILKALMADLAAFCVGSLVPDLVVFSGDLAKAGGEGDIYCYLFDDVLNKIANITRCNLKRFIIAPGNHDADQGIIKKSKAPQAALLANINDRDSLNKAYHDGHLATINAQIFAAFEELTEFVGITPTQQDGIARLWVYDELELAIISFNSALVTTATGNNEDLRKLLIPEAAAMRVLAKVPAGYCKIVVTHHPTNWLTEYCENDLQVSLLSHCEMHLFGHTHLLRPHLTTEIRGRQYLSNQAGALFQGARNRYNGYALISHDRASSNTAIHLRSYFDNRLEFGPGVDVTAEGVSYLPAAAKQFFYQRYRLITPSKVRQWLAETLAPAAQADYNQGIGDRLVHNLFVAPPLYEAPTIQPAHDSSTGTEVRSANRINLETIVDSPSNFVLRVGQAYGATTLLQHIALMLIDQAASPNGALTVPSVIDFAEIRPGRDMVTKLVKNNLSAEPVDFTTAQLLAEGLMTVMIDNVNFADHQRLNLLKDFITKYPRNRYFFTTLADAPTSLLQGNDIAISPDVPVAFRTITVQPFKRRELRRLVDKWDPESNLDHEEVLNDMAREFAGTNIPVTAVNATIFLSIYNSMRNKLLNRANLIQNFLDYLLERGAQSDTAAGSFDFTNKVELLSTIVHHMVYEDCYFLDRQKLVDLIRHFIDAKGWPYDPYDILDVFTRAQIFVKNPEGRLAFRYRAFVEYFVAVRMQRDHDFKAFILSEDNYLKFSNEIQYYAGLVRSETSLIDLIGTRFAELSQRFLQHLPLEYDKLDNFSLPTESKVPLLEQFEQQIAARPMTRDERDDHLSNHLQRDAVNNQDISRTAPPTNDAQWIKALFLYSALLKNLDMVEDHAKRRHLDKILIGWSRLTAKSLSLVPQLAEHREALVDGIRYTVQMPHNLSNTEIATYLYTGIPLTVINLLLAFVGTEKLSRQLLQPDLDTAQMPAIIQFFREVLAIDLKLGNWSARIPAIAKCYTNARYIQEILLRKLGDIFILGDYPDSVKPQLLSTFGDILARLRGSGHKDQVKIRSSAPQKIERQRLLHRIKIATEDY